MRQALVLSNKVVAGVLTETDDMHYTFQYDEAYLINPEQRAISLAFPKRKEEYVSDELFPFFFNMLSEGENRQIQSQLLHIDAEDDFGILLATAQTDTIGAVTVKPIVI